MIHLAYVFTIALIKSATNFGYANELVKLVSSSPYVYFKLIRVK